MKILSINFGHDASLCFFEAGVLIDFCEVERISRLKHHYGVSGEFILGYLQRLGVKFEEVDAIALTGTQMWGIAHSPDIKIAYEFSGLHSMLCPMHGSWAADNFVFTDYFYKELYEYHVEVQGLSVTASPFRKDWSLCLNTTIENYINIDTDKCNRIQSLFLSPLTISIDNIKKPAFFVDHHGAHSAYAAYYSGPDECLIVTHDGGVPQYPFASGGIYFKNYNGKILPVIDHKLSLGNIYDIIATVMNIDAGKLMGLASYAIPSPNIRNIINHYISQLNAEKICDPKAIARLIFEESGINKTTRVRDIEKFEFQFQDIHLAAQAAANVQYFVQEVYIDYIGFAVAKFQAEYPKIKKVFMTGGFSLNCPTNSYISAKFPSLDFTPLPAVGDTGISLGAAVVLQKFLDIDVRTPDGVNLLCAAFPPSIYNHDQVGVNFMGLSELDVKPQQLVDFIATALIDQNIICVHRLRSEVGPRALGHRSIIALATSEKIRDRINANKGRELWRPLAPITIDTLYHKYFVGDSDRCDFMLTVSKVKDPSLEGIAHVDKTARVQVLRDKSDLLYKVIKSLYDMGYPGVIINTSFNCAGEPIVETLENSATSFVKLGFDYLLANDRIYKLG